MEGRRIVVNNFRRDVLRYVRKILTTVRVENIIQERIGDALINGKVRQSELLNFELNKSENKVIVYNEYLPITTVFRIIEYVWSKVDYTSNPDKFDYMVDTVEEILKYTPETHMDSTFGEILARSTNLGRNKCFLGIHRNRLAYAVYAYTVGQPINLKALNLVLQGDIEVDRMVYHAVEFLGINVIPYAEATIKVDVEQEEVDSFKVPIARTLGAQNNNADAFATKIVDFLASAQGEIKFTSYQDLTRLDTVFFAGLNETLEELKNHLRVEREAEAILNGDEVEDVSDFTSVFNNTIYDTQTATSWIA